MSIEGAAFLERVIESPDDDGPRLVHADWLDEQGDPRGEFIRVQCALASMPKNDPRRPALAGRESVLMSRYAMQWQEPFKGYANWCEFRRGYIETVNVEARKFLARGAELFDLSPIRHIRLLDVGSHLQRILNFPPIAKLNAITIYARHLGDQLIPALCDSPYLDGLRSLYIGRNRIGDEGARLLAESDRFRSLKAIDLSDNALGDTAARSIARVRLSNLEWLQLRRNELSIAGLAEIAASRSLFKLNFLGVSLNYIGAPLEFEPSDPGVVSLKNLDLSENVLGPDFLPRLFALPGFAGIHTFDLFQNEIGDGGAMAIANWPGAESLRQLRINDNRIGYEGARALARSSRFKNLIELDLSGNPILDSGAIEFLNTNQLPELKKLSLPDLGLNPKMRRTIAERFES
jgi:uncharacterized protein (TIGR02996 family)